MLNQVPFLTGTSVVGSQDGAGTRLRQFIGPFGAVYVVPSRIEGIGPVETNPLGFGPQRKYEGPTRVLYLMGGCLVEVLDTPENMLAAGL